MTSSLRRQLKLFAIILFAAIPALAQSPEISFVPPPQDTLPLLLRKLQTTARILHITAHPDDEDGGMLTLESRGRGATVMLLTLTRGEGGQNKVGSSLFDELGILRTLELLESDRYYGVEQRFTRVADFGFSKTAEETFQKWHGHDIALADVVRVIREFQPDVITSRFQGTDRDGHGNHQAAGILAREAFRAAADPNRFPEQLKEGLLPWQAKKFYMDNVRENEDWNVRFKTSATDPELGGQSYAQIALNGLRHQLSQGAGSWTLGPEDRYSYYKLVDTVLPNYHPVHENDFMDGIDTTLMGLADRADTRGDVPDLRGQLSTAQAEIAKAATNTADPMLAWGKARSTVFTLLTKLDEIRDKDGSRRNSFNPDGMLTLRIAEKVGQLQQAEQLSSGVQLNARYVPQDPNSQTMSPGQQFAVSATLINHGHFSVTATHAAIQDDDHGESTFSQGELLESKRQSKELQRAALAPGQVATLHFKHEVGFEIPISRQYFHREDPERDSIYSVDPEALKPEADGSSWPPPTFQVDVQSGELTSPSYWEVKAPVMTAIPGKTTEIPLAIVPAFSLLLDSPTRVIPLSSTAAHTIKISVTSNLPSASTAELKLETPAGWQSEPVSRELKFTHAGEQQEAEFSVTPHASSEARYEVRAVLTYKGKKYEEGYSLVGRDDIGYAYYFQPALQRESIVNTKLPQNLKIGYIMGAGDDIPTVLAQLGLDVEQISAEQLAAADLSRYGTIILGIRAYDTNAEVKKYNQRLLDYVSNGGTLMVQYNAGISDFNAGHFTPYPLEIGRDRVSVEEAPVEILKPADPIFHFPNEITEADFANWVQERNVNVASNWDSHFEPLLSCHDPNEPAREGGLLVAHYGKGLYIYNTYSFFRQLPSGAPGAVRLYVNLLSAGHAPADK